MERFQFCWRHLEQRDTAVTWTAGSLPWPLWRSAGQPTRKSGLNQSEKRQQRKLISNFHRAKYKHPITWRFAIKIFSSSPTVCSTGTPWNSVFLSHSIFGGCININYWFSVGQHLLKFPFWLSLKTHLFTVNTHGLDSTIHWVYWALTMRSLRGLRRTQPERTNLIILVALMCSTPVWFVYTLCRWIFRGSRQKFGSSFKLLPCYSGGDV